MFLKPLWNFVCLSSNSKQAFITEVPLVQCCTSVMVVAPLILRNALNWKYGHVQSLSVISRFIIFHCQWCRAPAISIVVLGINILVNLTSSWSALLRLKLAGCISWIVTCRNIFTPQSQTLLWLPSLVVITNQLAKCILIDVPGYQWYDTWQLSFSVHF